MAHPDEVARELIRTPVALAQRHAATVKLNSPGYKTSHGITFDEQGRAIYINEAWTPTATGSGGRFLAKYKTSSNRTITAGSTARINFDTLIDDPDLTVTVGASWVFTAPATSWYTFNFFGFVKPNSGNWTYNDYFDLLVYRNGSIDGAVVGAAYTFTGAGGAALVPFNASLDYYLLIGDTFYYEFENQTAGSATFRLNSGASLGIYQWSTGAGGGSGAVGAQGALHLTGASTTLTLTNGSDVLVDYNITDSDPYSQFAGSTFTAGVNMTVDVTAALATTGVGSWAGGDSWTLYVKKNNVTNVGTIDSLSGAHTGDISLSGTATGITLVAGDFIEVYIATTHAAGSVSVDSGALPAMSIDRTA